MTPFATNLILAFVWAALNGGIGLPSLLVGFLIGYLVLFILQPLLGAGSDCQSL